MPEEIKTPTPAKQKFVHAHGRRKTAVSRIRMFEGPGDIIVNEKPIAEYFGSLGRRAQIRWEQPFVATQTLGKYYATVKTEGSGLSSQLDAFVQGISRSLASTSPEMRTLLKKAGLLTRDARAKERRKFGRAQKARKGKQSPKR